MQYKYSKLVLKTGFQIKNLNTMAIKGTIVVDTEKCKGCGVCVVNCPFGVIALSHEVNSKGYNFLHMVEPDKCTGCTSCATVCPDSVITVYRAKI